MSSLRSRGTFSASYALMALGQRALPIEGQVPFT